MTAPEPVPMTDRSAGTVDLGDGLVVRRMGFGAMRLTAPGVWGPPADPDAARAVLFRALDLGVNLVDTSDAYGPDVNEELIAEALHPYPEGLVVATKGGLTRPSRPEWVPDGRPAHLRAACEGSLRRLRVDFIDLYQLHRPDPEVPFAETIGTLSQLRDEGKIRLVGVSNVTTAQLAAARAITAIASVQNRYNVDDRDAEQVLRDCEAAGIVFLPWGPLGGGDGDTLTSTALREVAVAHGVSTHAVALAWLLGRSPVMAPIPGTSSIEHLEENIAAVSLGLTDDQRARLDGVSSALGRILADKVPNQLSEEARARIRERTGIFTRTWRRLTGRFDRD